MPSFHFSFFFCVVPSFALVQVLGAVGPFFLYPCSGLGSREHPPKPPFWKPPFLRTPETWGSKCSGARLPQYHWRPSDQRHESLGLFGTRMPKKF